MMPFAFDLISTLVMGSIFPVATTDRTIVPRSTATTLAASTVEAALFSVENAHSPATPASSAATAIRLTFLDFFIGVPVCRNALAAFLGFCRNALAAFLGFCRNALAAFLGFCRTAAAAGAG